MIKMNFYEPNVMDLPAASTEPLIKQSNKSAVRLQCPSFHIIL